MYRLLWVSRLNIDSASYLSLWSGQSSEKVKDDVKVKLQWHIQYIIEKKTLIDPLIFELTLFIYILKTNSCGLYKPMSDRA